MRLRIPRHRLERLIRECLRAETRLDDALAPSTRFDWRPDGSVVIRRYETDWRCQCSHDIGSHQAGRCFVSGPAPLDGTGTPRYAGNRCPCARVKFCSVCRNGRRPARKDPSYLKDGACRYCGRPPVGGTG